MTLPASGNQISFNDLRVELAVPSQAPFSITSASTGIYVTINTNSPNKPDASTPHAISEWYSYNHTAATCNNIVTAARTTANASQTDPTNCGGGGNEYTNGQYDLYSTNCSDLTSPTGCTIYLVGCTSTAYANGIRGFENGGSYYLLDASSNITSTGACNQ